MSDTLSAGAIATGQEDKIRQRAYELWESEGRAGSPEDHWLRAERELFDREPERSGATAEDAAAAAAVEVDSAATGEILDERFAD